MAKRKGKSRERIKDWHQRYDAGEEAEGAHARRRSVTRRAVKLPVRQLASGQEGADDLPRREGMVTGLFPGGAVVLAGADRLLCQIAKTFRAPEGSSPLAVGDNVTVAMTAAAHAGGADQDDKDRSDGMILMREPRATALARPLPRSGKRRNEFDSDPFEKIIVANMDVLLIVASTREPALRRGLIDRYLIAAERGELAPLLAVNKIDLAPAPGAVLDDLASRGLEVVPCSAARGDGMADLRAKLLGKRSVLAGASGVGKSTLINAMIPGAEAATRTVRPSDRRGRHTTSSAVVYDLDEGGIVVDTPGIRELGLPLAAAELPWYFPEFEQRSGQCKFNNCSHTHEPACAVIAAVEAGEIPKQRYDSYLRLLETLDENQG